MDRLSCRFEKLSNFSIGLALMLFGIVFLVLGATVLPLFGFIIAIPVLGVSILFFKAHRSPECITGE